MSQKPGLDLDLLLNLGNMKNMQICSLLLAMMYDFSGETSSQTGKLR